MIYLSRQKQQPGRKGEANLSSGGLSVWVQLSIDCRIPSKINGILKEHMAVSIKNGTPKSSILTGFSIINHPFWGTPIFGNNYSYPYNTAEKHLAIQQLRTLRTPHGTHTQLSQPTRKGSDSPADKRNVEIYGRKAHGKKAQDNFWTEPKNDVMMMMMMMMMMMQVRQIRK